MMQRIGTYSQTCGLNSSLMPAENRLPAPWKDFLGEIDHTLREPLHLHCIGGFALVFCYGIPRTTGDIDYYTSVPAIPDLNNLAGYGSALHDKYKICLQRVTVVTLPENYEERLSEMAAGQFQNLRLLVPDPYDCILSKLQRARMRMPTMHSIYIARGNCKAPRFATVIARNCGTISSARSNGTTKLWNAGSRSSSPHAEWLTRTGQKRKTRHL